MQYGIIYSIDANADMVDNDEYQPVPADAWTKTEEGEAEYDCFEGERAEDGEVDMDAGSGWHYKWVACLDQKQMDDFMDKMAFDGMCDCMGALGMPQPDGDICLGLCPAFALEATCDEYAMVHAAVTPYVMEDDVDLIPALKLAERGNSLQLDQEDDWQHIKDWFAEKYDLQ